LANPGRAFYRHEGRLKVSAEDAATRRIFQDAGWAPPPEEASDYELDEPEACELAFYLVLAQVP